MTETLPRRDAHAEHRDTRNIKRLVSAMNRDPSTLSVDEMSCVCALSRSDDDTVAWVCFVLSSLGELDAATRSRVAELVRAVGDE